jgi:hypothetical protein
LVIGCGVPQLPEPFGTEYVHRVRDKVVGREFVVGADVALHVTHDLGVPLTRTDLVANLTTVTDRVIARKVVVPPDINGHVKLPTGGHENCPLVASKDCPVADMNLPVVGMPAPGGPLMVRSRWSGQGFEPLTV